MLLAALLSGLALANSGLGAAHGIAAALGALAGIPHGKACAVLIPHVMRINLPYCIEGFAAIAGALADNVEGTMDEKANRAVEIVSSLCEGVGIPQKLSAKEVNPKLIPALVKNSRGSSMSGNPVKLSDEKIESILRTVISI
ncbi:MAG: iron-containing alcohol dehydrogenase, partial [Actinobacteria bacterium]|nr:iron-containing alcohol dehydrogenase [Actinomycetota bacterium]